jgi:hypothetical protein
MVPRGEFWQTSQCMQNASDPGAETSVPAASIQSTPPVPSDKPSGEAATGSLARRLPLEIGGPPGPEPTRYGDWEKKGRCIDF